MLSTCNWTDQLSAKYPMNYESSGAATASTDVSGSLLPFKITLLFVGVLEALTNSVVLGGFWVLDRSKINSCCVHVINHTTLIPPTTSTTVPYIWSHSRHFLDLDTNLDPHPCRFWTDSTDHFARNCHFLDLCSRWCGVVHSYDPCSMGVCDGCTEVHTRYSRSVQTLQLKPGRSGPVYLDRRCNPSVTRVERVNHQCCGPHP